MLLSDKHKFIFVHIYKNAGTSIYDALRPYACNLLQRCLSKAARTLGITSTAPYKPFPGHATAWDMVQAMGRETFDAYYSFAFVRNPWDWQVSFYKFMRRREVHPQHEQTKSFRDFKEYLTWRCTEEVRFQKDFVCSPDGELLVDFVGRFENLNEDFSAICSHLGISAELPRLNVSNTRPYREFYDDESREMVARTFARDISFFNYTF